jgi:hypothetical protein
MWQMFFSARALILFVSLGKILKIVSSFVGFSKSKSWNFDGQRMPGEILEL